MLRELLNFVIWRYFLNAGHYSDEALTLWTEGSNSENFIDNVEQNFLVAMMEGEAAGTGMIDTRDSAVDAIFVDPQFMKMGVITSPADAFSRSFEQAALQWLGLSCC